MGRLSDNISLSLKDGQRSSVVVVATDWLVLGAKLQAVDSTTCAIWVEQQHFTRSMKAGMTVKSVIKL